MTVLTYPQTRDAAIRVVAARGRDFIYNDSASQTGCAYVPADHPRFPLSAGRVPRGAGTCGCLVGEILTGLGLMNDRIAGSLSDIRVIAAHPEFGLDAEPAAVELLTRLQIQQDRGATWGQALDTALSEIEPGGQPATSIEEHR